MSLLGVHHHPLVLLLQYYAESCVEPALLSLLYCPQSFFVLIVDSRSPAFSLGVTVNGFYTLPGLFFNILILYQSLQRWFLRPTRTLDSSLGISNKGTKTYFLCFSLLSLSCFLFWQGILSLIFLDPWSLQILFSAGGSE